MKEQLVSFETAILAKEKGFLEDSFYHYTKYGEEMENSVIAVKKYVATHNLYANSEDFELDRWGGGDVNCIAAPTQSLLQKWLREEHNIAVVVHIDDNLENNVYYIHTCVKKAFSNRICSIPKYYKTYEEALEVGLFEALKLIK